MKNLRDYLEQEQGSIKATDWTESSEDIRPPLTSYITGEGSERDYVTPGIGVNVEDIIADYIAGYPVKYIQAKYGISNGQLFSHIKAKGIPLRYSSRSKSTLMKRLEHLTDEDIRNVIMDYVKGVSNKEIYDKYDIHKNGLYNILDMNQVERKSKR